MDTEKKEPKKPQGRPVARPRIDMSAMEPAADLVRNMFQQADRKLAAKEGQN